MDLKPSGSHGSDCRFSQSQTGGGIIGAAEFRLNPGEVAEIDKLVKSESATRFGAFLLQADVPEYD